VAAEAAVQSGALVAEDPGVSRGHLHSVEGSGEAGQLCLVAVTAGDDICEHNAALGRGGHQAQQVHLGQGRDLAIAPLIGCLI